MVCFGLLFFPVEKESAKKFNVYMRVFLFLLSCYLKKKNI